MQNYDDYNAKTPVALPPNLTGLPASGATSPDNDHWRFILNRHGRAINMCMADGSAKKVPLEDLFMYDWHKGWERYPLKGLPK